jgi:periplasmic divalent cation tolerance protein
MTTCGSEESAMKIAAALVDRRLAACVTMIPGTKSYYHFEGSTHLDEEIKMLIKTSAGHFEEASKLIAELHPYQVPEILMIKADAASAPYLKWMEDCVGKDGG